MASEKLTEAYSNRATPDGLYAQMEKTRELLSTMTKEKGKTEAPYEYLEMESSLRDYMDAQKGIAKRVLSSHNHLQNGKQTPKDIYGQYVLPFDMEKMTRSLEVTKEASERYLETEEAHLSAGGKSPEDHPCLKVGEETKSFAEQGMEVSAMEKKTLSDNLNEANAAYEKSIGKETRKQEVSKTEEKTANGGNLSL